MKQYICDKCKKVIKIVNTVEIIAPGGFAYNQKTHYDVCDECMMKLIEWMTGWETIDGGHHENSIR